MRIALGLEYDGSHFHGWQVQPGLRSVQGELHKALTKVANHEVTVSCAGRTDTGVHATGQVVHFETTATRPIHAWVYGCNSNLPKDICVRWAKVVDDAFHARFSAISRRYIYYIYNHPIRPCIFTSGITWQYRPLNDHAMQEAAKYLIGEHDFTSFRGIECQSKSPIRTIQHFGVIRHGDLIILDITANSFLHHMVRNIAGVLMMIGAGKREAPWIQELLMLRNRNMGAETAPAYGLYLINVSYDEQFGIPSNHGTPYIFSLLNLNLQVGKSE